MFFKFVICFSIVNLDRIDNYILEFFFKRVSLHYKVVTISKLHKYQKYIEY